MLKGSVPLDRISNVDVAFWLGGAEGLSICFSMVTRFFRASYCIAKKRKGNAGEIGHRIRRDMTQSWNTIRDSMIENATETEASAQNRHVLFDGCSQERCVPSARTGCRRLARSSSRRRYNLPYIKRLSQYTHIPFIWICLAVFKDALSIHIKYWVYRSPEGTYSSSDTAEMRNASVTVGERMSWREREKAK